MTLARTTLQDLPPTQVSVMLAECGRLKNAGVKSISIDQLRETDSSCIAVLTLFYSSGVLDMIPAHLFVKSAEWHGTKHALEVDFYQPVGPLILDGILLECYGFRSSVDSGIYCILLEDKSQTHILSPNLDDIGWYKSEYESKIVGQLVDGFADVHSLFWGVRGVELGNSTGDELLLDEEMIRGESTFTSSEVSLFLDRFGDRLGSKFHNIFREVSEVYPDLIVDRIMDRSNLTLTHRDPHAGNVFFQSCLRKIAPLLLTGLIVAEEWVCMIWQHISPYWHRTVRNAMEVDLLRRYHDRLCSSGVSDYDWDQCWYDCRLGVIGWLNRRIKHSPFGCAVGLLISDNCINAFDDLGCEGLLPA